MTNEITNEHKTPYQTPEIIDYGMLVTTTQAGIVSELDTASAVG
jgi:hypothetical protein